MHKVVCVGGLCQDIKTLPYTPLVYRTSNPAKKLYSIGGVAHNISMNLNHLNIPVSLISPIGNDYVGNEILAQLKKENLNFSEQFIRSDTNTAQYHTILENNAELLFALADMAIFD